MKEFTKVDLGSIKIHKKVLAEIAFSAVSEIKDVKLATPDFVNRAYEFFGIKNYPGILVNVDKNNQVIMEIKVRVQYGKNIHEIAREVQDVVRAAIERAIDIDLKDVNVNIQGIERGTP